MASTLDKRGTLSEDIAALAQLPSSSSQQSEEHVPLKTEVVSNSNASSMAVGTLQIRLIIHKEISSFLTSSKRNWNIGLILV